MKTKIIVLLFAIITSLFNTGCVVTAARRVLGYQVELPAAIELFNDIPDTVAIVRSNRNGEVQEVAVFSGIPSRLGVCGMPENSGLLVTVLLYKRENFNQAYSPAARSASYLGSSQTIRVPMHFDASGRFGASMKITRYDPQSRYIGYEFIQQ